ncbi:MAG TPA: 2-oxoglutarate dehydrogenase complex dihydrolipoyllysine-residue succinyltransferase [Gemmatimonadaceae bacterium]|nr:2-oxoglutarate dehydrogenase complex dihydrolipoyllysine-residue succinyltransferase [Gemmatimonadaceae bacterium]
MISIKVPPLGESIVEATVGRWLTEEGQAVAAGDPLLELETDKINVEVPAPTAGVLTRRLVNEGDTVTLDQPLAEFDDTAAGATAGAAAARASAPSTAAASSASPASSGAASAPAVAHETTPAPRAAASGAQGAAAPPAAPAAKRAAAERGVDLSQVTGTGRDGRITKGDVLDHAARAGSGGAQGAAQGATPPAPATPSATSPAGAPSRPAPAFPAPVPGAQRAASGERETREKMSTRRKRIAENLLQSANATARLTTFNEIDMSAVSALRARWRERVEKEHGVKLTFMPFFVRAATMALQSYPVVNAQVDGDSILYHHYVNMGIAVASDQGLVVPVIKDADRKGMLEVSGEMAALAKRARDGKLTMDDLTGGTFTITNGGVFGSLVSTPILNYPQVGILGLHAIQDRPVAVDGKVEIRPMMYVALTYDHRIVDGQQAVLFLVRVKQLMEDPASMLIA